MTADEIETRRDRLQQLREQIQVQQTDVQSEIRALLDDLVSVVHEPDPIRRQTLWPAQLIRFIAQHQDWICPACCDEIASLNEGAHHVDHVVPWSLGGGNEVANLQILHAKCNLSKGNRCDADELIRYLQGRLMNLSG